ncbi:hypothetical protein BTVI_67146 [Pitangus sulphuratus]|nr:hypothetical protein BTVI_67146 [Pitangus sulphuratus]
MQKQNLSQSDPYQIIFISRSARVDIMTNGVPQESVLGPVFFNIFINDIDERIEGTLSKFSDDTKLSGGGGTPEGWDAIQQDLDKLKKWIHKNLMRFNETKWKVLHLDWSNAWYQYKLDDEQTESSPTKKDLGVLVGEKLGGSQHWTVAAQRAKHVLGGIKSSMASR